MNTKRKKMNQEIDWSKSLQTDSGLKVRYIRRRPDSDDLGLERCTIREVGMEYNAGVHFTFPHVIEIEGHGVQTCRDDGYTISERDYELSGMGFKIVNAMPLVVTDSLAIMSYPPMVILFP